MIEGELLSANGLILEVCKVADYQCGNCIGFKKKTLCRKLPDCSDTYYFRKLSSYEIKRVIKAKKEIRNI